MIENTLLQLCRTPGRPREFADLMLAGIDDCDLYRTARLSLAPVKCAIVAVAG